MVSIHDVAKLLHMPYILEAMICMILMCFDSVVLSGLFHHHLPFKQALFQLKNAVARSHSNLHASKKFP